MATSKKAGATGAKTTKAAAKAGKDATKAHITQRDPVHPELHPERHAASGLTELPTAGGATSSADGTDSKLPAAGGAGAQQVNVDPQPSMGVTHTPGEAKGPAVNKPDEDAKYAYSYEQAASLPEVDKGTPLTAPTEAQKKAANKKYNDDGNEGELPPPVLSFKDGNRRTMLVVKTADGLGVMPAKAFKDVPAPAR